MELINQKADMEECKKRARAAGLQFQDNTLEYGVLNRDMLELMPKHFIPTLYDYWAQDVEVIRNKWTYSVYPNNPYEVVVNTRPPISFYNHDNAPWFNTMIFYHVLGHIDFDQNNVFFRNTWNDDFCGQALADKRLINRIREELGAEKRWVDYVIEFSLAIDNLVGYHQKLAEIERAEIPEVFGVGSEKISFYFGPFLKRLYDAHDERTSLQFYYGEIERYNRCLKQFTQREGEIAFFEDNILRGKFPEFNDVFKKWKEKEQKPKPQDIFEHLLENSDFLQKEDNQWMRDVMQVIQRTSLYFQPQIRTKICNEGWASLWHERLFTADERIKTREVDFAKIDSGVTMDPRLGFNVYAVGKHLYEFIENMAKRGKFSPEYALLRNIEARKRYNQNMGEEYGKKVLFAARKYLDDYLLINFLSDEDFQSFVDTYKYWTVGIRQSRTSWDLADVYIKSKSGKDFRRLLNRILYHPPYIIINEEKASDGELYLDHVYEGRSLHTRYVHSVLVGLEFLWGKRIRLETTEYEEKYPTNWWDWYREGFQKSYRKARVLYTCEKRDVRRMVL